MGAYLSHGAFSTPTEAKKFTISFWFKRSELGAVNYLLGAYDGSSTNSSDFVFGTGDNLALYFGGNAGSGYLLQTNRVFRDVNAWYHFVYEVDTTQATDSNRVKVYINGVQETSFSTEQYPPQNATTFIFNSANNKIGQQWDASTAAYSWDGSMTHFHFIDGTAYDASSFGETDATTGIWKPKTAPSVTYGTNGFFLKFENSGSLGTDSSGNGNNFTVNGTPTQTVDTPSNVFATLNPLNVPTSNGPTFANGNTTSTTNTTLGTYQFGGTSTLGVTKGKWYIEAKATIDVTYSRNILLITGEATTFARTNSTSLSNSTITYASEGGEVRKNSSLEYTGSTYNTGDIIQIALDLDNGYVYFGKNNTWQNSGVPTSGATGTGGVSTIAISSTTDGAYFFGQGDNTGGTALSKFDFNFGNGYFGTTAVASGNADDNGLGIFEYAPPTGYYALCTKNINAQEYS